MPASTAPSLRKQFLHLTLYRCNTCNGPVLAASTATRDSEITKESELTLVGAACLSCGARHQEASEGLRLFPPVRWEDAVPSAAMEAVSG